MRRPSFSFPSGVISSSTCVYQNENAQVVILQERLWVIMIHITKRDLHKSKSRTLHCTYVAMFLSVHSHRLLSFLFFFCDIDCCLLCTNSYSRKTSPSSSNFHEIALNFNHNIKMISQQASIIYLSNISTNHKNPFMSFQTLKNSNNGVFNFSP